MSCVHALSIFLTGKNYQLVTKFAALTVLLSCNYCSSLLYQSFVLRNFTHICVCLLHVNLGHCVHYKNTLNLGEFNISIKDVIVEKFPVGVTKQHVL